MVFSHSYSYFKGFRYHLFDSNNIFILKFAELDLQLDVKGCRDVYDSFDKYVEVERLEGDNKYHAEDHGLQVFCLSYKYLPKFFNLLSFLCPIPPIEQLLTPEVNTYFVACISCIYYESNF